MHGYSCAVFNDISFRSVRIALLTNPLISEEKIKLETFSYQPAVPFGFF